MWVVLIINSEDTRLVECDTIDEMLNIVTDSNLEGSCRIVRGSIQDPKALLQKCIEFGKWDVTDDIDRIQTFQSNVGLTEESEEKEEKEEESRLSGSVRLDNDEMSVDEKVEFLRSFSKSGNDGDDEKPVGREGYSVEVSNTMSPEEKIELLRPLAPSEETQQEDKADRQDRVPGFPISRDRGEQKLLTTGATDA